MASLVKGKAAVRVLKVEITRCKQLYEAQCLETIWGRTKTLRRDLGANRRQTRSNSVPSCLPVIRE
jgi:hypothetical protein